MRAWYVSQPWLEALAAASLAGLGLTAILHAGADRLPSAGCPPTGDFTVVAERHYTVAARVRPLLFWIRRDNVGDARLTWSAAPEGATRIELLIGADPERTPMRVNRWGYIAETTCGATTTVVGVMTESDEQSVEEAQAHVSRGAGTGHAFKAIRSRIAAGESAAAVTRLVVDDDLTFRDLDALLRRVPEDTPVNRRLRADGISQGFLAATSALVHESVTRHAVERGRPHAGVAPRPFAHGDRAFDLTLRASRTAPSPDHALAPAAPLLEGAFEVRNRSTGHVTRFQLTYAAEGPFAGVPVRIVYRPRWWLEIDLRPLAQRAGATPS